MLEFWKGHFDRGRAFHDWDKEKEVPAVCARCHGANGLAEFLKEGRIPRRRMSRTALPAPTATPTC